MVPIININNIVREPTHRHSKSSYRSNIDRYLTGGYVKLRESLYTRVDIRANDILKHIDTMAIWPMYKGLCMVYRPIQY